MSEEHKKVLFKEIWETFRAVDVSDYTEEKIGLTYLSQKPPFGCSTTILTS